MLRLSSHGQRTLEALRNEGTSRLATDIQHLSDHERRTLAAAIPILRGIADRRLTADTSAG